MAEPLHSFAVLAHGESPFLEQCLRSLESQTSRSGIYISASAPTAFLHDIAARHGLPLQINATGAGIAADWTFAYQQCRTRYLTLAHQDDIYLPEYARSCLANAARHPDCLITFTDYREQVGGRQVSSHLNLLLKRAILAAGFLGSRRLSGRFRRKRLLSLGCPIGCPSVMYNRAAIGEFSFAPVFSIDLDWDAWVRLADRPGSFCYVPEQLMVHRFHPASATSSGVERGLRRQEDRMMLRRFWPRPVADLIALCYAQSLAVRRAIR